MVRTIFVLLVIFNRHLFIENQGGKIYFGLVTECLLFFRGVNPHQPDFPLTVGSTNTVTVTPSAMPTTRPCSVSAIDVLVNIRKASSRIPVKCDFIFGEPL
jgi:hypothetical protein